MLIRFVGFLANADESVSKIRLDHGFKIGVMSGDDCMKLVSYLEHIPILKAHNDLQSVCCFYSKVCFIEYSFEADIEIDEDGYIKSRIDDIFKLDTLINNYIPDMVRLMRLFKEGNICMPFYYIYYIHEKRQCARLIISSRSHKVVIPDGYILKDYLEVQELEKFINNTKLQSLKENLQLAFNSFELSYQVHDINLRFLSLMIGLEALFSPGSSELTNRVSRNIAVFLGENESHSEKIFYKFLDFYEKRNIIHAEEKKVNNECVLELRSYIRDSIKKFIKINIANKNSKMRLLRVLNLSGFGKMQESLNRFDNYSPPTSNYIYNDKKLTAFNFCGIRYEEEHWSGMLDKLVKIIYEKHSNEFDEIKNLDYNEGKYFIGSYFFTSKPTNIASKKVIKFDNTDIYRNTDLSNNEVIDACYYLIHEFGYSDTDLKIESI